MRNSEKRRVLESLAQAARSDRLLLFVGAGLSTGYGLPNWQQLAEMLETPDPDYRDLPGEFSKYVLAHGKLTLHELLERKLGFRPAEVLEPTRLLLEIRAAAIVTTNCDRVLETAAAALGAPLKVFVDDSSLEDFHTTPWLKVIKLHGTLDRKESLVFTREEYAAHPNRVPGLRRKVAELMRYCNVLFVGYSMADPDFFDLMTIVGEGKPGHIRQMVGMFSEQEIRSEWRKLHLDDRVRVHGPLLEVPYEDFGDSSYTGMTAFLRGLRDFISPRELPSLSRQYVIFTNGYTATLKTELTSYLANCLGIPLLATHRYGRCTSEGILDPNKRHKRYAQLLADAGRMLKKGHSVILDGTFADPKWRNVLYKQARTSGAHIILVKTRCEDEAYIRARLWRRRLNHSRSEHEVTDFRNFEITRKAIEANPVEGDDEFAALGVEVITFENHGDRLVRVSKDASSDTRMITELLRISPLMSTHV